MTTGEDWHLLLYGNNAFFLISGDEFTVGEERQILYLGLCHKKPIEWVVVRFDVSRPGQSTNGKDVLIRQGKGEKSVPERISLRKDFFNDGAAPIDLEARVEGRKEGRNEGKVAAYAEMVGDGSITAEKAAKKLGMTEEEFNKAVEALNVMA